MQSLLAERDKAIQDMKEEKDDLEKSIEDLRQALRQQEQSADKFKEENWNLEVTLQELRTQLTDSQAATQRLEGEHKRLTKLLTATREAVDQHKNESEKQQNAYNELKIKHETDIAHARKHAASLQRDKSDLQQSVDALKAEVAKVKRLPRFGSPLTPNGLSALDATTPAAPDEDDVFSTVGGASTNNRKKLDTSLLFPADGFGSDFADESPDPSPSKPFLAPNHPSNEIEALQQRLAHAQRQINTLKGTLQREKELRMEYKRKLDAPPAQTENEEPEEFVDEDADETAKPKHRLTPYRPTRGRGRGRGRGKVNLSFTQRLSMAASSPASDYNGDFEDDESSPLPPIPALPTDLQTEVNGHERELEPQSPVDQEPDVQASPSPQIYSNRTSVDGMDPAFANVLRRTGSNRSIQPASSPLRRVISARSRGTAFPRRPRGGAAYQEARPPSLVGVPEALAAELGLGMSTDMDVTLEEPESTVETAEFGCQTDFDEPVLVQPPVQIKPEITEMAVQVEPEPIPAVVTAEASMQTDEEPKAPIPPPVVHAEMGIQHEVVESTPVVPPVVHSEIGIQHEDAEPTVPPVIYSEMGIQYEDSGPAVIHSEMGIQHESTEPVMILVSTSVSTEQEITLEPQRPVFVQAESQTTSVQMTDAHTQTFEAAPSRMARDLSMQTDISLEHSTSTGDSSGDTTIHGPPSDSFVEFHVPDDDDETTTETGSVFETDTDDYQDARQSISMVTPTDTQEDFHSIMTVTDNDFSESDEDAESIKASRLPSRQGWTSTSVVSSAEPSPVSQSSQPEPTPTPQRTYESKAVSVDLIEEPKPVPIPVEVKVEEPKSEPEPKPELKEMSVQTDDWTPPPIIPPPSPVPTPALYRVGVSSQQFQFISPPSSAGPTTTTMPITSSVPAPPTPNTTIRESTVVPRPRTSHSDRRQSIDSTLSSMIEDAVTRSRTSSTAPNGIDKSRPPMMILPPPPRQPPPPSAMLPPTFIPEKRPSTALGVQDVPPPRPSSPPPPELIQRATTPLGQALGVPGGRNFGLRHHGSSLPPTQASLRELPSTSSFRSSANPAARGALSSPSAVSFNVRDKHRQGLSQTSLQSGAQSIGSQRSSLSSDHHLFEEQSQRLTNGPSTPERTMDMSGRSGGASTDPTIIHAITQTMIGEFLYKYTRRTIGKGHGSSRHKRFFWIHPYTRTLYWSSADPGSSNVSESSAKSGKLLSVSIEPLTNEYSSQ